MHGVAMSIDVLTAYTSVSNAEHRDDYNQGPW